MTQMSEYDCSNLQLVAGAKCMTTMRRLLSSNKPWEIIKTMLTLIACKNSTPAVKTSMIKVMKC